MEIEIKNSLKQIYQALQTISTKGEDSVTMVKCFQALHYLINNIQFNNVEEEE